MSLHQAAGGFVTRAPSCAGSRKAEDRYRQPACRSEQHRPSLHAPECRMSRPRETKHQPREQSARQTTDDAGDRADHQHRRDRQRLSHRAEIDIVAGDPEAHQTRDHHRRHYQHRHALLIGGSELLAGEGHAGKRRVERRRHASGAACDENPGADRTLRIRWTATISAALIWTVGPSRPTEPPAKSMAMVSPNLAAAVRSDTS